VKWAAVIAIALGGVMFGLGELNGPFQRMMQIAGGFSIAIGAVAIAGHFFGGSPGTCS
jgi:type IV secretory pathway VirB2 component (pilin)